MTRNNKRKKNQKELRGIENIECDYFLYVIILKEFSDSLQEIKSVKAAGLQYDVFTYYTK